MCVLRPLSPQHLHKKKSTQKTATIHRHTMPKRHADSTQDENPRKRRQLSAEEVLVEAVKKGDTTAVRAALEKLPTYGETVVFDAAHETCRGNHDECLALLLPHVETTQVGFGILLSECVHANHVACTEVLLQHWRSVCKNVAFVPQASEHHVGEVDISCPAMWSDPAVCRVLIDAGADIETKDENGRSPLHSACASGALDIVKMLVKAGAGVRVTDKRRRTCLTLAADSGHTETVRYLVGLPEVDVNHRDFDGYTALHYMSREGDADVVQLLINAGADIATENVYGRSPLHCACESGQLDVVKKLVGAGAGVCDTVNGGDTCLTVAAEYGHTKTVRYLVGLPEVDVNHRDGDNDTVLHYMSGEGDADAVQLLIDAGADIEMKNCDGCSPLHYACESGALDVVKKLVRAGAGVCVTDNNGRTCLTLAVYSNCGHTETVRYLVGLPEVDVNHRDGDNNTALHWAVEQNHTDIAQLLIDAGADIEMKNCDGCSPLHCACDSGALDVVKMLVEAGAGVRDTDNGGSTCLTLAASCGCTETVRYLVGLPEVDVNHRDSDNNTVLHCASGEGDADVVQLLIDAGADIEMKNSGSSPLHCACQSGVLKIVKMLVEAGAGVCATNNDGDTCLTIAAYFGHTETVRYLVGLPEVDVNHRDANNNTALHLAVEQNHTDVVQLLIAAGADMDTEHRRTFSLS